MVKLNQVSKNIRGQEILVNLNYEFKNGTIYGLCGPNGSGKTMILRMIAGLVFPTTGTIEINGEILHKTISFPKRMGLIIEHQEMLPDLTAYENLEYLAKIKKIANREDILNSLQRVGLCSDKMVKKYSLGMKQRLNMAQAIFEKPELILLDEPTNALDQEGIHLVHQILTEEKERGACILIATHNEQDLNMICDKVLRVADRKMEELYICCLLYTSDAADE